MIPSYNFLLRSMGITNNLLWKFTSRRLSNNFHHIKEVMKFKAFYKLITVVFSFYCNYSFTNFSTKQNLHIHIFQIVVLTVLFQFPVRIFIFMSSGCQYLWISLVFMLLRGMWCIFHTVLNITMYEEFRYYCVCKSLKYWISKCINVL